jgi:hypothetical protein
MSKIYHKWDIITDTCLHCGIKRRLDRLMRKDGTMLNQTKTLYYIDGKWIEHVPDCTKLK